MTESGLISSKGHLGEEDKRKLHGLKVAEAIILDGREPEESGNKNDSLPFKGLFRWAHRVQYLARLSLGDPTALIDLKHDLYHVITRIPHPLDVADGAVDVLTDSGDVPLDNDISFGGNVIDDKFTDNVAGYIAGDQDMPDEIAEALSNSTEIIPERASGNIQGLMDSFETSAKGLLTPDIPDTFGDRFMNHMGTSTKITIAYNRLVAE